MFTEVTAVRLCNYFSREVCSRMIGEVEDLSLRSPVYMYRFREKGSNGKRLSHQIVPCKAREGQEAFPRSNLLVMHG